MNIVLVGASASGKTAVQNKLICLEPSFKKVVTYTTRPPRKKEINGVDYHFVSTEEFDELISSDFFVEHNEYRGWKYGTPKDVLLNDNENHIIVLTPAGFRALKRKQIKAFSVYIDVDRRSRLINLLKRGDDIEEAYRRSLSDVGQFDGVANEVDFVVDNMGYKYSVEEVCDILRECVSSANPYSKEVLN